MNSDMLQQVSENIKNTIGVEYEVIAIDNVYGRYGICQAYNVGQKQAKYDILVYVHEDVLFRTKNWGVKLIHYFNRIPNLGCVGIAGAVQKSKAPSAWWDTELGKTAISIIHHLEDGSTRLDSKGWKESENIKEVVTIDGVFMATRKSFGILFDESIPGFHCYDLNLSIELNKKGFKLIITKEILIEHFSEGNLNKKWVEATQIFHKKYSKHLPISTNSGEAVSLKQEIKNLEKFIDYALAYRLRKIAFYHWVQLLVKKPTPLKLHYDVLSRILKD